MRFVFILSAFFAYIESQYACRPADIEDSEYDEFYKSFSKDSDEPMCKTHFTAEGEVTFKSILFIPKTSPNDFQNSSKNRVCNRDYT